ncbi:MAG: NUDIX hydrolase [Desulfobacteraceae bacterium]|nr:NUDIX hydrolase [Desulfobacteraceae bacterium]
MAPVDYPHRPVVAVGAVVIHDGRVLLVKRGQPPSEDLWSIPGGSVKLGETLQAAAEREIKEETGLTVRAGHPVYTFDVVERDSDGRVRFHYVIVDVSAEYESGTPTPGDDAAAVQWVSPEALPGLALSPKTRELLTTRFGF